MLVILPGMELQFPQVSPFLELIQQAEQTPSNIVLRDHSLGTTATARQLLESVALLRNKLQQALQQNAIYESWNDSDDKFIFLIAAPGLEYVVSMLTIFSLGAAMSAQCKYML